VAKSKPCPPSKRHGLDGGKREKREDQRKGKKRGKGRRERQSEHAFGVSPSFYCTSPEMWKGGEREKGGN